jgi:hypothetical protein
MNTQSTHENHTTTHATALCYSLPHGPHRDTGLFVPLLAAVGVASLVSEYAEGVFSDKLEAALAGLYLRERVMFWGVGGGGGGGSGARGGLLPAAPSVGSAVSAQSTPAAAAAAGKAGGDAARQPAGRSPGGAGGGSSAADNLSVSAALRPGPLTVESVIATPARLYVRHTLPLEQARDALASRASPAAVVVDDAFSPLGIVYLDDIEAELVKLDLLAAPDSNFDRPSG